MLSYKKWKKINENFSVNLGVKTPNKIADLHSKWDEMGMSMPMPMKSKKSKKMFGGDDGPDMGSGPDDSMGGGDDGGGGAPPFMKKKGKGKKPPFPPHGGDDDMGDDDDMGGPGGGDDDLDADMDGDDMGGGPGGPPDHDDDDDDGGDGPPPGLGGDDDDDDMGDDLGDGDDDDMGGDDDGPGVGGPEGGPMSGPGDAPAPKGKKGGSFIDKTKQVADGAKLMHKGASKMIKGMKEGSCNKCDGGVTDGLTKKWAKKSKKMTKEESEFWRSLQSQTGATKFTKDSDGSWNPVVEDSVIPPTDPNANIAQDDDEPGPGQPGYAPTGRIGSFTEWAAKYKRKSKINESRRK